jgi:hypothetical protein
MAKFLWTERTNFGPSPRYLSATAYDSTRSRTVLFGGISVADNRHGDTWEWDGSLWTQMEDIGPSQRDGAGMAYDSARKVSILFGGFGGETLGDTWQWDGTDWTQLSESGPSSRSAHAMAFDSKRRRTVLFGGATAKGNAGDTWEFDGQDWTQVQDAGPSARNGHSMAYDSAGGRVVLFGGFGLVSDTWAWDGQEWAQIAEFGPPALANAGMVSTGGSLVLYGGVIAPDKSPLGNTWGFDGKRWTQLQDIGPGPLQSPGMAFDSGRNQVVLFGGLTVQIGNDGQASALSGGTWECPVGVPPSNVSVSSLSLPPQVFGQNPTPMVISLSGPAPAGGVVVTITGPVFSPSGLDLPPVTIPAGQSGQTIQVVFAPMPLGGAVTIAAQTPGTPAFTRVVTISPG